jgi:hypothetical protein
MKGRMGFKPVGVELYIRKHVKSNPGDNPEELRKLLRVCVKRALAGKRCHCGEPVWVIGSAIAGDACFACITGEADPSEDYEIDEVLEARQGMHW